MSMPMRFTSPMWPASAAENCRAVKDFLHVARAENVGGDVAEVIGRRCTFHAYPWKWTEGDACVIRLVAIFDPSGDYRLESGEGK